MFCLLLCAARFSAILSGRHMILPETIIFNAHLALSFIFFLVRLRGSKWFSSRKSQWFSYVSWFVTWGQCSEQEEKLESLIIYGKIRAISTCLKFVLCCYLNFVRRHVGPRRSPQPSHDEAGMAPRRSRAGFVVGGLWRM